MSLELDKHLDGVWEKGVLTRQALVARRETPPLIRIWDGNFNFRGVVSGELNYSFQYKYNDVGAGFVELPTEHHLAKWAVNLPERDTRNICITVDHAGERWSGLMSRVRLTKAADGSRSVTLEFLHDTNQFNYIQCWANPFLPAGVQVPKHFVLAGPAKTTIKTLLLVNLMRLHGNYWQLPDNPLDPATWVEGFVPHMWSIIIQPSSLLLDDSQWCVLDTRFDRFMDVVKPILEDAGLMLTTRRWLPGDPKPKGWIFPLRAGQLIVDVVDKSGVFDQTAHGGTVFGGMLRTATRLGDNVIDDIIEVVQNPLEPAEYSVSKFLGTAPSQPWVVFRDGEISPISEAEWVHEPATAVTITGGGDSAPGLHSTLSAVSQLVGNLVGAVFLLQGAGTALDTFLKPFYEDTLLAFGSIKSPVRAAQLGWVHYQEDWADDVQSAWSFSGLVAFREKFWQTRSRSKFSMTVDGGPWTVGAQGHGHFFLGDRVGGHLDGMPYGSYEVLQVTELTLSGSRDSAPAWTVTLGDPDIDQSPLGRALTQSKRLFSAIRAAGLRSS